MTSLISRRPNKTYLVDTGSVHFRVDLIRKEGRFTVLRVITDEDSSAVDNSMGELADDYLGQGTKDDGAWITNLLKEKASPAREITLLSAYVFSAITDIPILGGESDDEAVSMELESLNGLAADEAQFTWKRLASEEGLLRVWAIQASFEQLMIWRQAVSAIRGCYLSAISHPAGMPLQADCQLELWPGFAFFYETESEAPGLRAWNGNDAKELAMADEVVIDALNREVLLTLMTTGRLPYEALESTVLRLDDESGRSRWAEQLALGLDSFTQKVEMIPHLEIPKPEMSNREIVLVGAGITAAAICIVIGHSFYLSTSISRLEKDIETMQIPVSEVSSSNEEIKKLKRQLRILQNGSIEVPFDLEAHRVRLASMLHALAQAINEDVVMQEIESNGMNVLVKGVSATSQGAANYVRFLNEGTSDTGWRATLAGRKATLIDSDGGPWTFVVKLTPIAETAMIAQTKKDGVPK
ncbi:hypothetical protein [Rubellicoccus peritrichatus]|uniref:Uncharacterized protein n=1 Tax=Rubellicoccus peritrichatus TaxID=3080537 RepID=A0AAQ3QU08_9BACT|nr:hypothetical protein [Puniceicoccus sp. CR14]WOO39495.1 hypothetical protein RZN69_12800 [Puniceicoccus sp. CR14]